MQVHSIFTAIESYGANELTSECYKLQEREITRGLTETKVDTFKGNFNVSKKV